MIDLMNITKLSKYYQKGINQVNKCQFINERFVSCKKRGDKDTRE